MDKDEARAIFFALMACCRTIGRLVDNTGTGAVIDADFDLAVGAEGRVVAVWGQGTDIWQAVFTEADGWGPPFRLETASGQGAGPRVALGGERGMAIWRQSGTGAEADLQANEYRNASGWAGPQFLESQTGTVVSNAIAYDAETDSFVALWTQAPSGFASVYWSRYR